jgi:hypothetical protein
MQSVHPAIQGKRAPTDSLKRLVLVATLAWASGVVTAALSGSLAPDVASGTGNAPAAVVGVGQHSELPGGCLRAAVVPRRGWVCLERLSDRLGRPQRDGGIARAGSASL